MKYLKKFEKYDLYDDDEDDLYDENFQGLVDELHTKIISDYRNINDFFPHYDNMTGAIEWTTPDINCTIYATPYWEGELILPIDVAIDGETLSEDYQEFDIKRLNDKKDIDKLLIYYYDKIYKITEILKDRMLFGKIIYELLKYTPVKIDTTIDIAGDDIFIGTIKNVKDLKNSEFWINYNNISSNNISKLLNIIKDKYPEIFAKEEFNL